MKGCAKKEHHDIVMRERQLVLRLNKKVEDVS